MTRMEGSLGTLPAVAVPAQGALVFAQQHLRAYAASGTPEQKERLQASRSRYNS